MGNPSEDGVDDDDSSPDNAEDSNDVAVVDSGDDNPEDGDNGDDENNEATGPRLSFACRFNVLMYAPTCASDGNTYANPFELRCAQRKDSSKHFSQLLRTFLKAVQPIINLISNCTHFIQA